jgi:hypothetical protein
MAGDWLKMTVNLPDKPEVWQIAGMIGIDADSVVGKLLRVWAWFDAHTEDGNALGVTYPLVDRVAGVNGFAEAMALAGWLEQRGTVLHLPNFGRHNGKTAKNRALTNERVAKHRKSNDESNDDSVTDSVTKTVTREEKRREEKEEPRKRAIACPEGVVPQVWADWLQLRKSKRAPVTQTVLDGAEREAKKAGISLNEFLTIWCRRGSQGLEADWIRASDRQSTPDYLKGAINLEH